MGGAALFVMALGMGAAAAGSGARRADPAAKSGPVDGGVKKPSGVILLGVALWIGSPRSCPPLVPMLGVGGAAVLLGHLPPRLDPLPPHSHGWQRFWKGLRRHQPAGRLGTPDRRAGRLRDPLQPACGAAHAEPRSLRRPPVHFERVRTFAELDARIAAATRPVMLDFYADWCVSCKEMERFTFSDPAVAARMNAMLLLQADVTANNDEDKALLKRFGLFGPPGIVFSGRAVARSRGRARGRVQGGGRLRQDSRPGSRRLAEFAVPGNAAAQCATVRQAETAPVPVGEGWRICLPFIHLRTHVSGIVAATGRILPRSIRSATECA